VKPAGGYVQVACTAVHLLLCVLRMAEFVVDLSPGDKEDCANRLLQREGLEPPLGGLDVEHKPFKRHNWLLDGVLPTRTTRYKFLQASITRRERSDIVQRLGEAGACELLVDLFPLLPSVESAMDAVILFAALMENPQNRLRVDCKGVIGRIQSLQTTYKTNRDLAQYIDEVLLPKMQGTSELLTTPLGTEHGRPAALRGKPWMEQAVLMGEVAGAAGGRATPVDAKMFRNTSEVFRNTFQSSFGARSPQGTYTSGFRSTARSQRGSATMSRTAMSGFNVSGGFGGGNLSTSASSPNFGFPKGGAFAA